MKQAFLKNKNSVYSLTTTKQKKLNKKLGDICVAKQVPASQHKYKGKAKKFKQKKKFKFFYIKEQLKR